MTTKSTIFIVDDAEEVLTSIQWLVESVGYMVQTFTDAECFLEKVFTELPDCIIFDVRMSKTSGLEIQDILIKHKITVPIVFVTGHADVPMAVEAMKKGALDFITKPINNQKLLDAINGLQKCHRADQFNCSEPY